MSQDTNHKNQEEKEQDGIIFYDINDTPHHYHHTTQDSADGAEADNQHQHNHADQNLEAGHHTNSVGRHHHHTSSEPVAYYDAEGNPHRHHAGGNIRQRMEEAEHRRSQPAEYHKSDSARHQNQAHDQKDQRAASAHHDHHHHHHHHHYRPAWQRVLLIVAIAAVTLAAVVLFAWRILDALGKSSLYGKADTTAANLSLQENAAGTTDTAAADSTDEAAADSTQEEWQPGWIRYNGGIYEYNEDILNFLFLGIDKYGTVEEESAKEQDALDAGQADGQFLLVVNPDTKKIAVFAINRNTMTDVDVYDENDTFLGTYKLQICLAHGYGDGKEESCERAQKAVSRLMYDLPIHGYCAINMGGVEPLVDAAGGVTVPRMTYENGKIITGEDETLNGAEAYDYIRLRGQDFDAASYRLEKQKAFLRSFMAKLQQQVSSNPSVALSLFQTIQPYTVTDITIPEITYLADNIGSYTIDSTIYGLKGKTTPAEEAETGFEEFVYDQDDLYASMIQLFCRKISD